MKLKELTVRKSLGKKLTLKGQTGSYKSDEVEVESIMTFEDSGEGGIDITKAEEIVTESAKRLLDK